MVLHPEISRSGLTEGVPLKASNWGLSGQRRLSGRRDQTKAGGKGGSSWDSTVRGLHTPQVDSTGVGALFGQKGGGLDRIYALLRFALTSLLCFVIAGHRDRIRKS